MGFFSRVSSSYQAGKEREEGERYKRKARKEAALKKEQAEVRKSPSKWPYAIGRLAVKAEPVVTTFKSMADQMAESRGGYQKPKKKKAPVKKKETQSKPKSWRKANPEFFRRL